MSDDPYAALGVAKTATQDEIRKAYKKIAKESHPDLNPGDAKAADRFKAASVANDLLKDPEKRGRFDRGEIDASGQERPERKFYREYAEGPEATYHTRRGYEDFGDMSDVFADLFGERARAARGAHGVQMRGPDRHYTLEVGFLEAAQGATRRITLPDGQVLDVKIPAGLADGQTLRLRGKGGEGIGGGPAGDALVTVGVAPHHFFRREGDDILCSVPVTFAQAALGGEIDVPSLEGKVKVRVPPATQPGSILRLRGKGAPHRIRGGRGDQLVEVSLEVPTSLSDRARTLIEALGEELGEDVQPQQRTFVEKLKSLFG
jgi:DnaJ-class molecular chaperone